MVDLPTVNNGIITSQVPQSAITAGVIERTARDRAAAIDKGADALMEVSTRLAKEQAGTDLMNQKVTRNADGSVNVENPASAPLIFGDAGKAYSDAVKVGTVAQYGNVVSRELNDLHQQYPTDPQAFQKAAQGFRDRFVQDHGGIMGEAVVRDLDQQATQHYNSITDTAGRVDLANNKSSIAARQDSARNDVMAMLRGGASIDDPAVQSKLAQFDSTTEERSANALFGYSKEQAQFDRDNFRSEATASRLLYDVDKTYKDGGYKAALSKAQDILTNPGYKLSTQEREQYYHRAVGEIRTNEAIRRQDIGELRDGLRELNTRSALGQPIQPQEVDALRKQASDIGWHAGVSMIDSTFAHKDLHDDHGRLPLSKQTSDLYTLTGAAAAKQGFQRLTGLGYSKVAAAGIMGNTAHESGINPFSIGDNGTSLGLAQFHNERLTALRKFAAERGKPATDFDTQIDFIDHELHTTETATLAKLQAARTPEEAGAAFVHYERPQGYTPERPEGSLGYQNRQMLSRAIFAGAPAGGAAGPGVSSWLLANRKATLDDASTKEWKQVWADWSAGKGGMPPADKISDIQNAARATHNIDLQDKMAHDLELMDRVERMSQLSLPDQHALESELQRRIRGGTASQGDELVNKQLQARTAAITTGLADNPISTAVGNFPNTIKSPGPLDFSSDQNLIAGLKVRGQIAQFAAQNWQTSALSALDQADVGQVQAMLSNPDPSVKGRVFNALSTLPEDVRNATLAKIGKDRPDLMVSVAAGSMMKEAPEVASSIIRGQAAIKMDNGYLPSKGAEATAFEQKFDEHVPASIFSLAARTDASGPYAVAQGMVRARYADLSAQAGDTKGKLDNDRLTRAVDDVTGGILDHNGGKLIAPKRGMPQTTFDRTMYGMTDADLGHGAMPSNLAAADAALKLTPQEQALYQRHLTNLSGTGGVTNANGSRSTLFVNTFGVGDKTVVVPSVWDGKILTPDQSLERAKAEGLDKFPSYASDAEANARYGKMHDFMEKDTAQYNKGNTAAVTTLNGEAVTSNYLRNSATLESVGDGRYYVKLGKDPMKPVYAYTGANTESPQKFMLDLRNRLVGPVNIPVSALSTTVSP